MMMMIHSAKYSMFIPGLFVFCKCLFVCLLCISQRATVTSCNCALWKNNCNNDMLQIERCSILQLALQPDESKYCFHKVIFRKKRDKRKMFRYTPTTNAMNLFALYNIRNCFLFRTSINTNEREMERHVRSLYNIPSAKLGKSKSYFVNFSTLC